MSWLLMIITEYLNESYRKIWDYLTLHRKNIEFYDVITHENINIDNT